MRQREPRGGARDPVARPHPRRRRPRQRRRVGRAARLLGRHRRQRAGRTGRPVGRRLLDATRLANRDALAAARAGEPLRHIGRAVERRARRHGFSVIQNLNGHGTGRNLWETPERPRLRGPAATAPACGRAWCWPSSRSCRPAPPWADEAADGWTLVTPRPPDRPVRAHRRRHQRRPARPHRLIRCPSRRRSDRRRGPPGPQRGPADRASAARPGGRARLPPGRAASTSIRGSWPSRRRHFAEQLAVLRGRGTVRRSTSCSPTRRTAACGRPRPSSPSRSTTATSTTSMPPSRCWTKSTPGDGLHRPRPAGPALLLVGRARRAGARVGPRAAQVLAAAGAPRARRRCDRRPGDARAVHDLLHSTLIGRHVDAIEADLDRLAASSASTGRCPTAAR